VFFSGNWSYFPLPTEPDRYKNTNVTSSRGGSCQPRQNSTSGGG